MVMKDAENGPETVRARPETMAGSRMPHGRDASNATARLLSPPEANGLLMELVVSRENMMAAYARVVGNRGAAGIDKMSVADLKPFLVEHWPRIREDLLADRYQPQAVRGVEIPKPGGGMRQLGIPTAVDRLIQQALQPASGADATLRSRLLASLLRVPGTGWPRSRASSRTSTDGYGANCVASCGGNGNTREPGPNR